jgi:hypothetical protein
MRDAHQMVKPKGGKSDAPVGIRLHHHFADSALHRRLVACKANRYRLTLAKQLGLTCRRHHFQGPLCLPAGEQVAQPVGRIGITPPFARLHAQFRYELPARCAGAHLRMDTHFMQRVEQNGLQRMLRQRLQPRLALNTHGHAKRWMPNGLPHLAPVVWGDELADGYYFGAHPHMEAAIDEARVPHLLPAQHDALGEGDLRRLFQ